MMPSSCYSCVPTAESYLFDIEALKILVLYVSISAFVALLVFDYLTSPPIPGIFSIPCPPVIGSLFQVARNPARTYLQWSKQYGRDLFQVKLGGKRVIVVNSYNDAFTLWAKHPLANNSRPVSHIFHDVVSATQGFTVGSTPAGASFIRKKKTLGKFICKSQLSGPIFKSYLEVETDKFMATLDSFKGEVSLQRPLQMFVLKFAILVAYGLYLDSDDLDKELCNEIVHVESQIIRYRGLTSNISDFFPLLSYLFSKKPSSYGLRRDAYMQHLMQELLENLDSSVSCKDSIVGRILLNENHLSASELQSICLTFVSAGLDNTPLNLNHLLGHFSQPSYGQSLQERAYKELLSLYGSVENAWYSVSSEIKCDYVVALLKETLRFFTVLPLSLPRQTTRPIVHRGIYIPENTTLIMNAYAANHDDRVFYDPYVFAPERWLVDCSLSSIAFSHMAFGLGSRACSGAAFATTEMYTLLCKIILKFKILPPDEARFLMQLDPFESNADPTATSFDPKEFRVRLERREPSIDK